MLWSSLPGPVAAAGREVDAPCVHATPMDSIISPGTALIEVMHSVLLVKLATGTTGSGECHCFLALSDYQPSYVNTPPPDEVGVQPPPCDTVPLFLNATIYTTRAQS